MKLSLGAALRLNLPLCAESSECTTSLTRKAAVVSSAVHAEARKQVHWERESQLTAVIIDPDTEPKASPRSPGT